MGPTWAAVCRRARKVRWGEAGQRLEKSRVEMRRANYSVWTARWRCGGVLVGQGGLRKVKGLRFARRRIVAEMGRGARGGGGGGCDG